MSKQSFANANNTSKTDVAPWCYKWDGWDWDEMDGEVESTLMVLKKDMRGVCSTDDFVTS